MRKDKPSMTARKVALNIVTLGAKPGIHKGLKILDSRLRGNDDKKPNNEKMGF